MSEKIEATGSPNVATSDHKESFAVLNGCLVDGDAEQRFRERQVRRRALGISIALQSTALLALLIIPLIGRTERISTTTFTPIPPYRNIRGDAQIIHRTSGSPPPPCRFCPPTHIPPTIEMHDPQPPGEISEPSIDGRGFNSADDTSGIPLFDSRPAPPREEVRREPQTRRLVVGHLEPAMLVHRIEPVYPTLPKQIGRSGKVELRAIIAMDGSIQTLEAVDGDPMFFSSALDAVRQWRYRPTILNGVPVEVDTHITVIYSMQR